MNRVLISGAGVAGPTLAWWLARAGWRVTLVERASALRSSGSPVDIEGPALDVVEEMGLVPALRDAATAVNELVFVDGEGRRTGSMRTQAADRRNIELPRGDLARILASACPDVELLMGDSVTALDATADGVAVCFERAAPRRFDLVVGADGVHSKVRRLAFGEERKFVHHRGLYVATLPVPEALGAAHEVILYNTPGRALAVHPSRGRALAAFMFRSAEVPHFDHRDLAQHRRLLREAYRDAGFVLPRLLDIADRSDELYFDSVSSVDARPWCRSRVVLLGDAASCISLFGNGTSLALIGARTLARALVDSSDPAKAFAHYEREHRRLVEPKKRQMALGAAILVPKTDTGIWIRNSIAKLWSSR